MDSFELNKIIGAILGTLLFVMGIGFLADGIYEPGKGTGPGYDLPAPADTETADNNAAPAAVVDVGTLLATADPKAGEADAKKCQACHDLSEGGPNKIGPNLYDVVERQIASHPGFSYSAALSAHSSDKWTYENLNKWLTSPRAFANGTKMTYAGDTDDKDRANIIAFLSTLSHSPKPFPAPAAPAASSAAPATTSSSAEASSEAPASSTAPASSSAAPASSEALASSSAAPASSEASSAAQ